jgi:hypothetical protein
MRRFDVVAAAVLVSLMAPTAPAVASARSAVAAPVHPAALAPATGTLTDLVADVRTVAGTPQGLTRGRFGAASLATHDWRGCDGLQRALISAAISHPRVGTRCAMTGGTWRLTADGTTVDGAAAVRMIPVLTTEEAWAQGAFGWTATQRQAFAMTLPTIRSSALSSSWPAAKRNCTITRSGASTGLGCAYAVVPAEAINGEHSLLDLATQTPEALDCQLTAALAGTLVAWDLSVNAPVHAAMAAHAAACPGGLKVARARTPMDMEAVLSRNPYLPGSTMLPSTADLLTAPAGAAVAEDFFGLHILPGSGKPDVPFGMLRLWDAGVGWDILQPRKGEFDWASLDRIVLAANAAGHRVLYTLGRTPWWAANHKSDPPRRMSDLKALITAMVRRYGDRIYAYEMWNEANLKNYFTGTPAQMAQMTAVVKGVIDDAAARSLVVGASSTVRIMSSTYRFYPAYLAALKRLDWPLDAFAVHTYPRPAGGPDEHTAGIVMVKAMLDDAHAPDLPILDTEVNFGLGGLGLPKRDIDQPQAGAYVAQTFLEALRMGLSSVEWYGWSPRTYPLLGLQLDPATTNTNGAWTGLNDLLVGARFVGCAEQGVAEVCGFERNGARFSIAYSPSGVDGLIEVPAAWSQRCTLSGACTPIENALTMVGISPIALTGPAA